VLIKTAEFPKALMLLSLRVGEHLRRNRRALAAAAEARGWAVHWYDAKKVCAAASQALRIKDFDAHSLHLRKSLGPPWSKDHKTAMAAAIVAAG
jgi:hypothetical protein